MQLGNNGVVERKRGFVVVLFPLPQPLPTAAYFRRPLQFAHVLLTTPSPSSPRICTKNVCFSSIFRRAEYQKSRLDDEARKHHAERIVATYISPTASGVPASLIYTSEAQRKALAVKMKRLWRKDKARHKDNGTSGDTKERDGEPAGVPSEEDLRREKSLGDDPGVVMMVERKASQDEGGDGAGAGGRGGGDGGGDGGVDGGRRGVAAAPGALSDEKAPDSARSQQQLSQQEPSSSFTRWDSAGGASGNSGSDSDGEMMDGIGDEEGRQPVDRRKLSMSLFDEILDQNAIPTIRQNSEFASRRFC